MRFSILLTAIILLHLWTSVGYSQIQISDIDFQVWNETTVVFPVLKAKSEDGKISDRLSFLLLGTIRLGQNRMFPVDERIGAGFEWRPGKNFAVTPSYLYRVTEPIRSFRQATEHQLRFDASYEKNFGAFAIKDRPRIEYRIRNSRPDVVNFRNRLTFKVPIRNDGKELIAPFISEEPFYDFRTKRWNANELSIGFSRRLSPAVSAEFFYMLKNTHVVPPRNVHAVGMNLRIRVD